MSNRRHSAQPLQFPPGAFPGNGNMHAIPQQIVQQMTPFNDVQTIAWLAAQIQSTSNDSAEKCVEKAQDLLFTAIETMPRFMAKVQELQKKMQESGNSVS